MLFHCITIKIKPNECWCCIKTAYHSVSFCCFSYDAKFVRIPSIIDISWQGFFSRSLPVKCTNELYLVIRDVCGMLLILFFLDYRYAGAQGTYCNCGYSYGKFGKASGCTIKCAGDPREGCGGVNRNQMYDLCKSTHIFPANRMHLDMCTISDQYSEIMWSPKRGKISILKQPMTEQYFLYSKFQKPISQLLPDNVMT